MTSKTDIANMALGHIGVSKSISNIDTDDTTQSRAINQYYETALNETLAETDWSFARTFKALELVEENPSVEYAYSYRFPTNAVAIRKIYSGLRSDVRDTRIPYEIYSDATGKLIYTDQANAKARYTVTITNTGIISPSFVMAFTYKLAFYVVPTLSGGDPFKLKRDMLEAYMLHIGKAEKNNFNHEQADYETENSFIRARE